MDHLESLFNEVLIYVAAFGITELIIKYFNTSFWNANRNYYSSFCIYLVVL